MKKKVLGLLLASVMALSVVGCGGSDEPANNDAANADASVEADADADASADAEADAEADAPVVTREAGKITILYPGEETARFKEFLENEFAERVKADIGLEIEMIYLPWDQYWTQKEIMLSANEAIDLYWDGLPDLATIVNRSQAQPLDDLLNTYGQDLLKAIPLDRFVAGKVNGEIYGIPSAVGPSSAQLQQVCVRQDILEAVGMTTIETADDLYQFAVKAKEQFPDMRGPADPIFKPLTRAFQTEQLTWCSGNEIAVYGEESKKVYSYYETETFQEVAKFNQKMYDEGLYSEDLTIKYGERDARMQQGLYLWIEGSFGKHNEIIAGVQQNAPEAVLNTYLPQPEADKYMWTVSGEGLFIPYSATNPEGAIQFLNWLYANEENHQFAIYGVEGTDYTMEGDRIVRTTSEDFFYEWMFRHQDYTLFTPDTDQAYIDSYQTWDADAKVSDVLGFVFNNENVLEIETAITEVVQNDMSVIRNGFVNFDEFYPAAVQRIQEAGSAEYIAEIQKQFDEFMASR